jgi:hypothetical protein
MRTLLTAPTLEHIFHTIEFTPPVIVRFSVAGVPRAELGCKHVQPPIHHTLPLGDLCSPYWQLISGMRNRPPACRSGTSRSAVVFMIVRSYAAHTLQPALVGFVLPVHFANWPQCAATKEVCSLPCVRYEGSFRTEPRSLMGATPQGRLAPGCTVAVSGKKRSSKQAGRTQGGKTRTAGMNHVLY